MLFDKLADSGNEFFITLMIDCCQALADGPGFIRNGNAGSSFTTIKAENAGHLIANFIKRCSDCPARLSVF